MGRMLILAPMKRTSTTDLLSLIAIASLAAFLLLSSI